MGSSRDDGGSVNADIGLGQSMRSSFSKETGPNTTFIQQTTNKAGRQVTSVLGECWRRVLNSADFLSSPTHGALDFRHRLHFGCGECGFALLQEDRVLES